MPTTNHSDEGLSVSRALAESESPSKKDSATEKKVNKNSKVEEATETEVVQGDAGAREACERRPDTELGYQICDRCGSLWGPLLGNWVPLSCPDRRVQSEAEARRERLVTCDHEVVTVGNRRWCLKRYDAGGCGAHWRRADKTAPWVLDEVRT